PLEPSSKVTFSPSSPPTATPTNNDEFDQLISHDEWLKNIKNHNVIVGGTDTHSSNLLESSSINHTINTNVDQILQDILNKQTTGGVKNTNCLDLYKEAGMITKDKFDRQLLTDELENRLDLSSMSEKDFTKWTYTKLVESKVITQMIDTILDKFRSEQERLTSKLIKQHELQWCIMVDNSGSMSVHRTFIFGTLVVIMEVLRKLETKFAVARFGGRTNQKILKNLNDHFTYATGLARITQKVFPIRTSTVSTSNTTVHKMVIILTDGLTQERDNETYSLTISKYDIKLGFMFIEDKNSNSSTMLLEALKRQSKHSKIASDSISNLPLQIAQLMNTMLENCLQGIQDKNDLPTTIIKQTINIEIPIDSKSLSKLIYKQQQHQNADENKKPKITKNVTSYTVSQPNSMVSKLINVKHLLNQYLSRNNSYTNLSLAAGELRKYYQELSTTSDIQTHITHAEELWHTEETRLSNSIDDLMSVSSDVVFAFNKFTRRRAALRGSSLYLPGLIKAMTSEWSYKKIFSSELAGGKRDHALCLVLDISVSMFGNMGECLFETLIIFIGALKKLGLDNYSIVLFGKKVTIIKTHEQTFDIYVIYTLLQQIKFDQENDSKDAFGSEVAIDLLTNCATRG
ncbi:unnamed protein product, partial [Didymodactylos carnosus]